MFNVFVKSSESFKKTFNQAFNYVWVGGIGFLLDVSLFILIISLTDFDIIWARVVGFTVAVSATWYLNRKFTFRAYAALSRKARNRQYRQYFAVQISGAALNLLIFYVLVRHTAGFFSLPIVAVVCAAFVSVKFNFLFAKYLVFKPTNNVA